MKRLIKKIIVAIQSKRSLDRIVFESNPDFSDNSRAVYDEIMRRGYQKQYKMIWLCKGKGPFPSKENTYFVRQNAWGGLKAFWHSARAKYIISGNMAYPKNGSYQKSIYVMHGVGLKKAGAYSIPDGIDYITCLSETVNKVIAGELNVSSDVFVTTGFPRNDDLLNNKSNEVHSIFGDKYDKIIVWYPTYRQHSTACIQSNIKASSLPIIHDEESAQSINEYAKSNNALIVLKPHFSQDMSYIKELNLDHILFINDSFFSKNHLSSYEFVGGCDALITDYSSIYFDYLLCDKPIAAVWEDIDEYRATRGFAFDIDYFEKGAFKIYNVNDMKEFIRQVCSGEDNLSEERREIRDIVHKYKDSNSTMRVVDFIMKSVS